MSQSTVVSPYADFQFYQETFLGESISESDFKRLELRAEEKLDMLTFHRIKDMDEKFMTDDLALNIRKAVCAIAEASAEEEAIGFGIGSESNDGYSVSFSQNVQQEMRGRTKQIAISYLGDSGLLYRGGGAWYDN